MRYKRGQVSVEYVAIIGFLIVIAIPLFYYTTVKTNQEIKISQADTTVTSLANTADSVYALGPGSKKQVWITIPKGVTSSSLSNREILLKLSIFGSTSDIHASTKAELTGEIPTQPGSYKINAEMLEDGRVYFYVGETTTCSLCKTNQCNTYSDCSVGEGQCASGYCCEGSCSTLICSGFCMSNPCDSYTDCAIETGQCGTGYCCTGNCGVSTCSGYCMPLSCSSYESCADIQGETCGSGSCCTGTCGQAVCRGICKPNPCSTYENCAGDPSGGCISGYCCTGVCEVPICPGTCIAENYTCEDYEYCYDTAGSCDTGYNCCVGVCSTLAGMETNETMQSDFSRPMYWQFYSWGAGGNPSGVWHESGGDSGSYIDISLSTSSYQDHGGYWEIPLTVSENNPDSVTCYVDWKIFSYGSNCDNDILKLYAFLDTTSGSPLIANAVWSQAISHTTGWSGGIPINCTSKVTTAGTYYYKLGFWLDMHSQSCATSTMGYDNAKAYWEKAT